MRKEILDKRKVNLKKKKMILKEGIRTSHLLHVEIKGDKFRCSARLRGISAPIFCVLSRKGFTNTHCTLCPDPIIMSSQTH